MLQNHIDIDVFVCKQADVADRLRHAKANGEPFDILISIKSPRASEQGHVPYEPALSAPLLDKVDHIVVECPEYGALSKEERLAFAEGAEQAALAIKARAGRGHKPRILLHCYSGNTRSLSLALALLELVQPDKKTKKISDVIGSRRCAAPRDELIRLATCALRGGAVRPRHAASPALPKNTR